MRRLAICLILGLSLSAVCFGEIDGKAAYAKFLTWREAPENSAFEWPRAVEKYESQLRSEGLSAQDAAKTISIIAARDEATLYDPAFSGPPKFQTAPTTLLVEAVKNRTPGKALDVAMGQGRNSIFLAQRGWDVTGFDVSQAGLTAAKRLALDANVRINTIHASDEEFDFGVGQWDLIAILYPIEKRSIYRVREALKPGGIIVVECSHIEDGKTPFGYDTNELLEIFDGFRILKYEDVVRVHEWARRELRLVRLIAQK